jgi:copper resistance protein C
MSVGESLRGYGLGMHTSDRRLRRWWGRVAALLLLTFALAPVPAGAHAELDTITPANGSSVDAWPAAVQLRFTEPVTSPFAMSVTGPSGRQLVTGQAAVVGERLVQKLVSGSDGPGTYTVAWQATSVDRHLVYGVSTFTLSGAGAKAAGATTGPDPAGDRALVFGLGAGLLLLLSVAVAGIGRLSQEAV